MKISNRDYCQETKPKEGHCESPYTLQMHLTAH